MSDMTQSSDTSAGRIAPDNGPEPKSPKAHRPVALALVLLVAGMVGLSFAAVPLYQLFCQVTGYGGTTQRADAASIPAPIEREMTVRFDVTVSQKLALKVVPAGSVTDQIGNSTTVFYLATNLSDQPVSTTAGFNVTPLSAGVYFNKVECFCFTQQTIAPGETAEMGITFFLDPELDLNSDLDALREVTLSYTFYPDTTESS